MNTIKHTQVVLAEFDTHSFTFQAIGETEDDAYKALENGWKNHCFYYKQADKTLLSREDVRFIPMLIGHCYRDCEPVS